MKFLSLLFLVSFFNLIQINAMDFKRAKEDDGTMGCTWLPKELAAKMDKQPTMLAAKYAPEKGDAYYILAYAPKGGGVSSIIHGFFKVTAKGVEVLGENTNLFPLSRFVKEPTVIDALWKDYLDRWTKTDGKDALQERINARSGQKITDEEVSYLQQAGFTIPKDTERVENYQVSKKKP